MSQKIDACGDLDYPSHVAICPNCFRRMMDDEISAEDFVMQMIRQRFKPYFEEIRKEDEKIVRKFLEGTGSQENFRSSILYLSRQKKTMAGAPVLHALKNPKGQKPSKISPYEKLRRRV